MRLLSGTFAVIGGYCTGVSGEMCRRWQSRRGCLRKKRGVPSGTGVFIRFWRNLDGKMAGFAVAHNKNDVAETFLFNVFRGAA